MGKNTRGRKDGKQILVRLPALLDEPIAPGDRVRLRSGREVSVVSLRAIATVSNPRVAWILLDLEGRAYAPREVLEIVARNGKVTR